MWCVIEGTVRTVVALNLQFCCIMFNPFLKLFLSCLFADSSWSPDYFTTTGWIKVNKRLESLSFTELKQCAACPVCRVAYFHSEPFTLTQIHFTHNKQTSYVHNRLFTDAELLHKLFSRTVQWQKISPASDTDFSKKTWSASWFNNSLFEETETAQAGKQWWIKLSRQVLLGFEPKISCLQDRRFNQLSDSTSVMGLSCHIKDLFILTISI